MDTNKMRKDIKYFEGGGGFVNKYKGGEKYKDSTECAYFSNHTLNDQGYMMSGNAWTPKGFDMVFNGFDGITLPEQYSEDAYNKYANDAADNVYKNFSTKDTLDPDSVYTVNMYYATSPNKEKAFNEGSDVRGTHTGYLNFDQNDNTWYVTHNIHGKIHKNRFLDLQKKGGTRVTAIMKPRKNTFGNRVLTFMGFKDGGNITYYL